MPTYDDTGHIAVNVLPAVNNWIFDAMGNVLGTHRPAVDWWTGTKQSLTVPTTAPALSSATAPPPDLAASLPAPSVLTGASSTRHDLAAENVLAGVPVVVSGSSYRSIVADLAVSHAAAAFATSARMAVATLTYRTDQAANRAALAIQAVLLNAGAALHVDSDNLKYLALTNGNSITTIGFLRGPQSLSVVVTTSADATTEQVRARNALRTIGSNRGIPLP